MADASFVSFRALLCGLDTPSIWRPDDDPDITYLYLDMERRVAIRLDRGEPGSLERDRRGLRRLAAVAIQLAQEIEQRQRAGSPSGLDQCQP
jgi:hypothetical protein